MKPLGCLVLVLTLGIPAAATAQEAAPPARSEQATEFGIYVHHVGSVKRLVGAGGKVIAESRNLEQFITRIGGTTTDNPGRTASEEQVNAAVLNVLARQGWDLVSCQLVTRINDDYMYSCYLKRSARQVEH